MFKYKISIAVPIHNTEMYIRMCIESILNQSLENIQIILLDNGSTDNTPAILDEYSKKYPQKIKVIHKEDKGYGQSINVGLENAEGEYFAIVESDDIIRPLMYETLYKVAKENGDIDIVKADYANFQIKNGILKKKEFNLCSDKSLYNKILYNKTNYVELIQKIALYTWSGIYRTEFLRKYNIKHNETPGASYQDNGFWFLSFINAKTFYFVNKSFYLLRRDNPNSSIFSKEKVYCIRDEYEYILNYLKERPDLYKKFIELYWWARFGAYRFSYNRIDWQYKKEFLLHFRKIILKAILRKEVNIELYSKTLWDTLSKILNDPDRFLLEDYRRSKESTNLNKLLWCYEDNGLKYTINKIFEKITTKIFN